MIRLRACRAARVARLLGVVFGLLGAGALCGSPGASAARSHAFSFSFGGAGVVVGEAGSLSLAPAPAGSSIAVNNATHNVYVADTGNRRVDEFKIEHEKGMFVRAWGWGVATGAAELQECIASCRQGRSGSEPGEFEAPTYIAVDNSKESASQGDVYVADVPDDLVTKFTSEGKLITSWGDNGENASHERTEPNGQLKGETTAPFELFDSGFPGLLIAGIAVDGSGTLWVYNKHRRLYEFEEDGTSIIACDAPLGPGPGVGGIVVNDGKIYVHDGFGQIEAVTPPPSCANPGLITSTAQGLVTSQGVAIDPSDGDFYVVHEGSLVEDIPGTCVPSLTGCQAPQGFGGGGELSGATGEAIDGGEGSDGGRLYVANGDDEIVAFDVVLEANIGPASAVSAHEATLHASVNPENVELQSCEFEYGTTTAYGSRVSCEETPSEIGHGEAPVAVKAVPGGLSGGVTYHFRLHASSKRGTVFSEDAQLQTLPTAMVVGEQVTSEVSAGSVTFQAVVNPEGLAAKYHFEYGECEALGQCVGSSFPERTPDDAIAAGLSAAPVSQTTGGSFTAGATWHFRIIVEDANGVTLPTPEGTFVLEPGLPDCALTRSATDEHLADCRLYEMVTPPEKDGALVANGVFIGNPAIALDGSRVISPSIQCFDGPQSCQPIRQTEGSLFSFHRTGTGWATETMAPPASAYNTQLAYDADTNVAWYAIAAQPPGLEQFYAREPDGTFSAIGPIAETNSAAFPVGRVTPEERVATADLSRVVYQGELGGKHFWPSLAAGSTGADVLEYVGVGNSQPMLVGVSGGRGSLSLISACSTSLGGGHNTSSGYGSLSADGRTVFFTAAPCSGGTGVNASVPVPAHMLYERVEEADGEMKTVPVSGSGPASACNESCGKRPTSDALFEGASSDGSRVFFTDTAQLTNEAGNDQLKGNSAAAPGCRATSQLASGCNLYEFVCPEHCEDTSKRELIDVSSGDTSGLGPRVQGVVAIPPDGSDVYFVASGVLTSKPNQQGAKAVPGGDNLYVYRFGVNGGEGNVSFIATLVKSDVPQWAGVGHANTTSDGRFLVFTSHRALTNDVSRAEGPAQVYRYDAQTEKLLRVSVGQAGFGDNGNASTTDASIAEAFRDFGQGVGPGRSDPTMSDNGEVVFFQSAAGLTPGALNDHPVTSNPKALAQNIYEWQADGARPSANAPACNEAGGCVSLISDGKDVNEGVHEVTQGIHSDVELLGTDMSGANVFFTTGDPLVGWDTDSQVDIYDARVDGGFAEPTVTEPCVTLSACRVGASVASSLFAAPGSSVFAGSGNQPSSTGSGEAKTVPRSRSVSRARRLRAALRACRKRHGRVRVACERRARRRFAKASGRTGR